MKHSQIKSALNADTAINRRTFIGATAALAAGMASLPLRSRASTSANDKIGVALIGCRNMGWHDLRDFLPHKEVNCLALCDIDSEALASRYKELSDLQTTKPAVYSDYRKVLDRKDVDLVIIGTPDHWHCLQFIDACDAGKDVYVEKPLANSIAECDAMVAAALRNNRIVQVGQQQRSSEHWKQMTDYLKSGALGRIGRVKVWANFSYAALPPPVPDSTPPQHADFDAWLGPAPARTFNTQRFHGSWRMFWDYGGGLVTDWGVHLLDMALWGMGVTGLPLNVSATGGKFLFPDGAHETFDTLSATFRFNDFVLEWENNAGCDTGPYGRNYGVLFRGTNGTLVANRDNWEVYPEGDKTPALKVQADYADHRNHVTNFLECVKSRNPLTACTVENAALCAKYAHLANIGARTGMLLEYDDVQHTFHSAADVCLKPAYRSPWKFPA